MPDKFHSGTMNTPAIKALGAGVKYVMKYGVDVIGKYEKMLSEKFKENLMNMDNVITVLRLSRLMWQISEVKKFLKCLRAKRR